MPGLFFRGRAINMMQQRTLLTIFVALTVLGSTHASVLGKQSCQEAEIPFEKTVKVKYKNWRSEVAVRTIIPQEKYWGKTEWHPHEQWLLKVWDVEKNAERIYAFDDILEWLEN